MNRKIVYGSAFSPFQIIPQKLIAGGSRRDSKKDAGDAEQAASCHDGSEDEDTRKPDLTVHLTLFRANILEGEPQLLEHNDEDQE